jgi:hypothetical protein
MEPLEKNSTKSANRFIVWRDAGMGILILLLGVFFFGRDWMHWDVNLRYPPDQTDKWFGVVCFFYGSSRIYRGWKATKRP